MWQESNRSTHSRDTHTHTQTFSLVIKNSVPAVSVCFDCDVFSDRERVRGICFLAVRWADHRDEWVLKEELLLWHFINLPLIQTAPLLIGHSSDLKPPSRQADRSEKHASNSGQHDVNVMVAKGLPFCLRAWSWGCWCCWRPWPPWLRGTVTGGNTGGAPACVNTLQRKAGEDS